MNNQVMVISALALAVVLLGCQGDDFYRKQREEIAKKQFEEINRIKPVSTKAYSLNECIDFALKNNLDLKASQLKQAVSSADKYSEMLKMFPESNIGLDLSERNNENASTSIDVHTGEESLAMSTSSKRDSERFNVDVAFSAIDFGLAYLTSVQAQDRLLQDRQMERRAAQNLILDVVKAYFNVAAAQDAVEKTNVLLEKSRQLNKLFDELAQDRSVSALRILDEKKRFIQLEDSLMVFERRYEDACIELKSLMGVAPMSELKVDTSLVKTFDTRYLQLPDLYLMEKIALRQRPELYQLDMELHIASIETDKSILKMFPNVKAFLDFTQDSNPYLYKQSWAEIGLRSVYDVARMPSKFMEYKSLVTEKREKEIRIRAMSFAVLAQVRVSFRNMDEVYKRYKLDDRLYNNFQKNLELTRSQFDVQSGSATKLDLCRMEMETVEAEIYRTMAVGNCYLAYYRALNAAGLKATTLDDVDREVATMEQKIEQELPFMHGMNYIRDDGVIVYNGVEFLTFAPEKERDEFDVFANNGFRLPEAEISPLVVVNERWSCSTPLEIFNAPVTLGPIPGSVTRDGKIVYNGIVADHQPLTDDELAKLEKLELKK